MDTHTINDVEIFKVGTWNGNKYTEKDLDGIVDSFQKIGDKLKPYLKLGHDKDQKLIQEDGLPSIGWISDLKRKGTSLVANFSDVPKKIKELIDLKAYKRVSSEIYVNLKEGGNIFPRALKAVALLGANTPAVTSLDDIIAYYTEKENYDEIIIHTIDQEEIMEKEIKEVLTFEKEYKQATVELQEYKDENEKLKADNDKLVNDAKVKEFSFIEKEVETFIEKAIEDKKVAPALKEHYTNISLDKENMTYGNFDAVKAIVDGITPVTGEVSVFTEPEDTVDVNDAEKLSEILHDKALNYIKENNLENNSENYKLALVEVE